MFIVARHNVGHLPLSVSVIPSPCFINPAPLYRPGDREPRREGRRRGGGGGEVEQQEQRKRRGRGKKRKRSRREGGGGRGELEGEKRR